MYSFPARLEIDNSFLTPREAEVLWLCLKGMTIQQTANALGVSNKTVCNHRDHVRLKFGLTGPHGLMQFGVKHRTVLKKWVN